MKRKLLITLSLIFCLVASLTAGTFALYQSEIDDVIDEEVTAKAFVLQTGVQTWVSNNLFLSPGGTREYTFTVSNASGGVTTEVVMDLNFSIELKKTTGMVNGNDTTTPVPYLHVSLLDGTGNVLLTRQFGHDYTGNTETDYANANAAVGIVQKNGLGTTAPYATAQGMAATEPDDYFDASLEETLAYTVKVEWPYGLPGVDYDSFGNVNGMNTTMIINVMGTQCVTSNGHVHAPKLGNTTDFAGGFGTSTHPFIVYSKEHWLNMIGTTYNAKGNYFKLSDSLTTPLDLGVMTTTQKNFQNSTLDGNNKSVTFTSNHPLFYTISGATIKNITFKDCVYTLSYNDDGTNNNEYASQGTAFIANVIDTAGTTNQTLFQNVTVDGASALHSNTYAHGVTLNILGESVNEKYTTVKGLVGAGVFAARAYVDQGDVNFVNCTIRNTHLGSAFQPSTLAGFVGFTTVRSSAASHTARMTFTGCTFDNLIMYSYSYVGLTNANPYTNIYSNYYRQNSGSYLLLRGISNVYTVNNVYVDGQTLFYTQTADYNYTSDGSGTYFNALLNNETRSAVPVSRITRVATNTVASWDPSTYVSTDPDNPGGTIYNFQLNGTTIAGVTMGERKNTAAVIQYSTCNGGPSTSVCTVS